MENDEGKITAANRSYKLRMKEVEWEKWEKKTFFFSLNNWTNFDRLNFQVIFHILNWNKFTILLNVKSSTEKEMLKQLWLIFIFFN